MYSLRTILANGEQNNVYLGDSYSLLDRFVNSGEAFRNAYENFYKEPHVADLDPTSNYSSKSCIAFIIDSKGHFHSISKYHDVFIVTDSGQTYQRLNRAEKEIS